MKNIVNVCDILILNIKYIVLWSFYEKLVFYYEKLVFYMFFFKSYPNLTVIIACLFWGTYWIPLRYIDNNNNSSVWPLFLSFLLLALILIKPLIKSITNVFINRNYFFLFGCFFAALGIALYSESLLRGEIAKVVVLFYLCPIWGTVFAKFFLKPLPTVEFCFV